MKWIFLTIIVFLSTSTVFSDVPDKILHNRCLYPVIQVHIPITDAAGSATIIRSEKVGDVYRNVAVTCGHLFAPPIHRYVVKVPKYKDWSTFDGYDNYDCLVYICSSKEDLAIILFESKIKMFVATIDFDAKLYIGSDVFRVGCGLGDTPRLDYGKITAVGVEAPSLKSNVYRTNIYSVLGDSGGPVFHKNSMIAMTHSIRSTRFGPFPIPVYGISYALPVKGIKKWDKELNNVIGFVYDASKPIPVLPFAVEKAAKVKLTGKIPKTYWSK